MLKRRLCDEPFTIIVILLLFQVALAGRTKRQIVFQDDSENRLFNSECLTPDWKSGHCIRLTSCTTVMEIKNFNRLRQYFCGFAGEEPKVCCPQTRLEVTTRRYTRTFSSTARTTLRSTPTPRTTSRSTPTPRTTSRSTAPRTTSRSTSRTTIRPTTRRTRTTVQLTEEPRNFGSATIGTTIKPRDDRKAIPSFLPKVCGKSLSPQQRVVGGTVAGKGSWPWMAVVSVMRSNGALVPDCGGALVTNKHVVTAAHCVVTARRSRPLDPSRITVRLGANNLTIPNERGAVDIDVEDVRRHEQFDPRTYKNDIAVLKLKKTVNFTNNIAPVCLPYSSLRDEDLTSRAAYVIGYGTSTFNGNGSDVLMQAGFYIQSQEICKRAYEKEMQISRVYLCAGMMDGSKDACQGDSGGPLVAVGENTSFYLVGVVSFGKQCGLPNYPGVYTRVTEFLDWLARNISY